MFPLFHWILPIELILQREIAINFNSKGHTKLTPGFEDLIYMSYINNCIFPLLLLPELGEMGQGD